MFKKTSSILLACLTIIFFLNAPCLSSTLYKVRLNEKKDLARLVFDLNSAFKFKWARVGNYIQVELPDVSVKEGTKVPAVKKSRVLGRIVLTGEVSSSGEAVSSKIYIYLKFPSYLSVYPLFYPNRLVLDLRLDLKEFDRMEVAPGLEYIRLAKPDGGGPVAGGVLRVNPEYFDVFPALAAGIKYEPSFWESVMLFFKPIFPWVEERVTHFFKQTTSGIAKRWGAAAGVNGTYFSKSGRPLGILMVNGELITSPIYDRTALIISSSGEASIDNVLVRTYVSTEAGTKIYITGINEPCDESDIILYTPKYGNKTDTRNVTEAVVRGRRIRELRGENSNIPADGYVLSAGRRLDRLFKQNLSPEHSIEISIEIIPYSINGPVELKHIIGGGPRLIKAGRAYVSKKEEKFKRDIALARTARTAVGITKNGDLLFVTIDKTSRIKTDGLTPSAGMTLEELSRLLLTLGAYDAMNLDGGGSTTMVINGKVVSVPATGHEIPVSNAVLIKQKI